MDEVEKTDAAVARVGNVAAARRLFRHLARARREVVVFAYLDAEMRLLGMRHSRGDGEDRVGVPLRTVTTDALAFGAHAIVMVHNHPSGEIEPSSSDIDATRTLARTLGPLGIRIADHLIVTADAITSLFALGLL